MRWIAILPLLLLAACQTATSHRPGDRLWSAVTPLCGQAFAGRLIEGTEPSDAAMGEQTLVMHVAHCSEAEIRIPFHVGTDRSRTWKLTRTDHGIRLKHDHRHEDGTPDRITEYGGDTNPGTPDGLSLDFHADEWTASLIPAARTNIWTFAVDPGKTLDYALRREESGRRFRVRFDLTKPIPPPPPAW